ncbi:hypothetical protein HW273_02495 [Oribacterium sp. oral taxon 102]|uniref:hypothetical protein n=1 Tax=Oribacterium sp. oral taxon 102 TaxID=671214 RepID=UPI0015B913FE|nr:hypothetical protein [Oribacterium sp. oral taxon 102]NWO20776.1 hypothetical protein [Oribacterium sp. oral taxon 102]
MAQVNFRVDDTVKEKNEISEIKIPRQVEAHPGDLRHSSVLLPYPLRLRRAFLNTQ